MSKRWWIFNILEVVGITLIFNVLTRHGVIGYSLDWWIVFVGTVVFGLASYFEGRLKTESSESPYPE